jgi:hypothetical protein
MDSLQLGRFCFKLMRFIQADTREARSNQRLVSMALNSIGRHVREMEASEVPLIELSKLNAACL